MIKICLDPGHGGPDSGAVSKSGLREADVALNLAEKVSGALGQYEGVAVTFTRDRNNSKNYPAPPQGLYKRVDIANQSGADLFLSLHNNCGGGSGFESYAMKGAPSRTLQIQKVITDSVLAFLKGYGIGAHGDAVKNDTEGAHSRIYVLRATKMPAVLLENLFIDNPNEERLLRDGKFLDGLAQAIAEGVAATFGLKKKAAPQPKPMHRVIVDGKSVIDSAYKDKVLAAVSAALDKYQDKVEIIKR
ncbi:N-acetylmuramoyl-L-alanine amidase [Polycladomyces sp. WAk]|uniref:N-acetylmuramoyl-L-alanine amidase n=1 Tax=Polycladomyces zharkentensis TaxID=2807616 RepID=A0ABS2WMF9_9BACL|nr:N-acetylmuramoyl-L-alanine amidase [Polycladomyces sp. WAk]MBN2910762.1 N-acetylmuramoyl-L-alanine amidase [Polycladomyces sp. WAk]